MVCRGIMVCFLSLSRLLAAKANQKESIKNRAVAKRMLYVGV